MVKKGIIVQILVLCLLLAGIGVGIIVLYSNDSKSSDTSVPVKATLSPELAQYPLFQAVPADAAAVMSVSSLRDGLRILGDTTSMLPSFFSGTGKRSVEKFLKGLAESSLKEHLGAMAVSLHYDRDLVPLVLIEASDVSSTLILSKASALSLYAKALGEGEIVAVSPSSAVLTSASRHYEVGASILDLPAFGRSVSGMKGKDAIFVVGKYWSKLVAKVIRSPFRAASSFLTEYSDVMVFTMSPEKDNARCFRIGDGNNVNPAGASRYLDRSKISATEVLPSTTVFAIGQTTGDMSSFIKARKQFLDANGRLSRYDDFAEKWAAGLDIKEIVKAVIFEKDEWQEILCLRLGKPSASVILKDSGIASLKEYKPAVIPYAYSGYASIQFGAAYAIPDEGFFYYNEGWMVVGGCDVLTSLLTDKRQSLEDFMNRNGIPHKGESPFFWFDASAYATRATEIFTADYVPHFAATLKGLARECVSIFGSECRVNRLTTIKAAADDSSSEFVETVVIEVPGGPFTVTNFKTNKKNKLVQNPNKSVSLLDEKGKSQWTIPFSEPLCGYVSDVDLFGNGKIQFLFAAGSKFYVLDRLGRFVRDYPAETGKEILLGPVVFDGYTAMVLHKDNTLGMYNLHGVIKEGWKGIAPEEQIAGLPEQVLEKGKKAWKVPIPSGYIIYPYLGGEAIRKEKLK
ncbi:MAG: hypothetical protein IJR01_02415 [Bacteroidales bacterium]|nr:hypothetical protein [Bacteroidales bacterium]